MTQFNYFILEKMHFCSSILLISGAISVLATTIIDSDPLKAADRPTFEEYEVMRRKFLNETFNRSFGSEISLSELEEAANKVLMTYKVNELTEGFLHPSTFAPSQHIFESFAKINQSKVYRVLRKMPKGGILHAHDMALISTRAVMKLTYRKNLWILGDIQASPSFIFSENRPKSVGATDWQLVSDVRRNDSTFDSFLEKHLTLFTEDPLHTYKSVDEAWSQFMKIFGVLQPIITYDEVWNEYFLEALAEFLDDGVQYLEFRGVLPTVSQPL